MRKLVGSARTDKGLKRENNEDSFLADDSLGLYLIADGMGGAAGGELASRLVTEAVGDYVRRYMEKPIFMSERYDFFDSRLSDRANTLMQAIYLANSLVFDAAQQEAGHKGMGSTLAAIMVDGENAFIVHVGDSRVYLSRSGRFVRLTVDHRLSDDPKMRGVIDPDATIMNDMGNILTRAMGIRDFVEPDFTSLPLVEGDLFLICSDGLSDMVEDEVITKVLAMDRSLDQKAKDLINLALAGGGRDNITLILVSAGATGLKGLLNKITKGN